MPAMPRTAELAVSSGWRTVLYSPTKPSRAPAPTPIPEPRWSGGAAPSTSVEIVGQRRAISGAKATDERRNYTRSLLRPSLLRSPSIAAVTKAIAIPVVLIVIQLRQNVTRHSVRCNDDVGDLAFGAIVALVSGLRLRGPDRRYLGGTVALYRAVAARSNIGVVLLTATGCTATAAASHGVSGEVPDSISDDRGERSYQRVAEGVPVMRDSPAAAARPPAMPEAAWPHVPGRRSDWPMPAPRPAVATPAQPACTE